MLVSITWLEYAVIILIALAMYYIVIAVLYYRSEISTLRFKKAQQQKNRLSNRVNPATESEESFDTFFQNQIKDNQNHEFENNFIHHEDIEEKAVRNRLTDEVNFSTSPLLAQPELFMSHQKYTPPIQETDDTFQQVQELTAGLKEAIATAVDKNYIKEEFIRSLQLLLKKYYFLKGSPFLVSINNLITSECEKYGYIHLSAEERVMLWNE